MRILTFGNLYPSTANPQHGVFTELRLRALLAADAGLEARVVAPVPWFPFRHPRFGAYATYARVPAADVRHGVPVLYPRYPSIPKVGMGVAPQLMYRAVLPAVERLRRDGFAFDLIDAYYFYPDGVAAAMLARRFGVPLAITALGSDVNILPGFARPRRMILEAARLAGAMVTVSQSLKDALADLGAPAERIHVVRNGVDLDVFTPPPCRAALRLALDLPPPDVAPVLLFVGNLVPLKRCHLCIEALTALPAARLVVAGAGPERPRLEALAARLGVADRVRFLGRLVQDQLAPWYGAADALLLPSEREGLPNVVMEAMACGTPVVASHLPGTAEAVSVPAAGRLVETVDGPALAAAVAALLAAPPSRDATRRHAESFSWQTTGSALSRLYRRLGDGRMRAAVAA
ncbi:glycosyltransferase [Caenispirillum bisanense]|uniref:glycosyltransferase n=1 Tax=Caenispirillum bisanense TaxID=414052 RepID=UPI0031DD5EBB